jgi:hypothetical protein
MTLPLRIVIRTRTPWETMTSAEFYAQSGPQSPSEFLRVGGQVIPAWEKATGLNYFRYRGQLRDRCESALREIGIPITVGADRVDWHAPDEALIPIDDDDMLYPSVLSIGDRITPDVNLVIWKRITNYLGNERAELHTFGGQLDTCNWAIRKSFLLNWCEGTRHHILSKHWHAAGLMYERLGGAPRNCSMLERAKRSVVPSTGCTLKHPSIMHLEECHSVYYLHSASISYLTHKLGRDSNPVETLRRLPLHPMYVPC